MLLSWGFVDRFITYHPDYCVFAVEDLLLWRDVKLSGAVVLGVTVVYFGLIWLKYSLVTLIANVLLLAVAIFFGWNNVAVSVAKR